MIKYKQSSKPGKTKLWHWKLPAWEGKVKTKARKCSWYKSGDQFTCSGDLLLGRSNVLLHNLSCDDTGVYLKFFKLYLCRFKHFSIFVLYFTRNVKKLKTTIWLTKKTVLLCLGISLGVSHIWSSCQSLWGGQGRPPPHLLILYVGTLESQEVYG
jgi:hypothetical protein